MGGGAVMVTGPGSETYAGLLPLVLVPAVVEGLGA